MGGPHLIEGLNRTKRLILLPVRGNSYLTAELGYWSFPAFGLKLKYQLFLCVEPASLWMGIYTLPVLRPLDLDWDYTISSLPTAEFGTS